MFLKQSSLVYIGNVFFLSAFKSFRERVLYRIVSFLFITLGFVCRDCLWLHQTVLISFLISFLLINEWYKTVYLFWRFRAEFRHASTDKTVISVYLFFLSPCLEATSSLKAQKKKVFAYIKNIFSKTEQSCTSLP